MIVDVVVDYHYDAEDKLIELTSVKWYDKEIVEMISDKAYDEIVQHISDDDLWRGEE
tara:strand:- start:116 stop:286 length:171 start_codon:yes stop_codon:yes gene_type:complete